MISMFVQLPGLPAQPDGAVDGLRIFYSGFPIIGTLIGIDAMHNYSLTEERANEIRTQLENRINQIVVDADSGIQ